MIFFYKRRVNRQRVRKIKENPPKSARRVETIDKKRLISDFQRERHIRPFKKELNFSYAVSLLSFFDSEDWLMEVHRSINDIIKAKRPAADQPFIA